MPQGRRGHVLRSRSNLVSTESDARSANKPMGLACSQILNLGSFRASFSFSLYKSFTGYFDDYSRFAAGSAFFAGLGHLTNRL